MATDLFHFEQFESFSPYTDVGPFLADDYWKLSEVEIELAAFWNEVERRLPKK